jgi:tetratricopeptide (TPR) repeat protein
MATNPLPRRPPSPPGSPSGGPEASPSEPVPPEQGSALGKSRPAGRRGKWIAAGVLAGGLGLGGLLLAVSLGQSKPGPLDYPSPPPSKHTVNAQRFLEAKQLIRDGKWVEARERFLELQQQAPDLPSIPDYLAHIEKELPNHQHLVAAQEALKAGQLARVNTELDAVSPDTSQYEQVTRLRRELRDVADQRARDARTLLDKGQLQEARLMAQEVLALFPQNDEARLVVHGNDELLPPPGPERPTDRFIKGDLPGAVKLARACAPSSPACKTELEALNEFSTLYKKGEKLGTEGLVRLVAVDRELTGTASRSRLTQELITELRQKAKDLFLLCYTLKDTNPEQAERKFHTVMSLTLPEDELHQKAKGWLEKLQR